MPIFSISHDLFSDITANERFPALPEKELANLRGKNQNTSKSAKTWLNVFNEWEVRRNEARKLKDISSKKGRSRIRTRKFGRHAMLDG